MKGRSLLRICWCLSAVLLGCSGDQDGGASSSSATEGRASAPRTAPVPPSFGSGSTSTPSKEKSLSDFLVGSEEERLDEQRRIGEMTAGCMADKGRPYVAPPPSIPAPRPITDGLYRFDVYAYPEFMKSYGYGIATVLPLPGSADPNEGYLRGLSVDQRAGYVTDLDACRAAATSAVVPKTRANPANVELMTALDQMLLDVRRAPDVERGVKDWSACMAAVGYSYRDPESVTDELRARYEKADNYSPALASEEMAVSAADLQCFDSKLRSTYERVRRQAEQKFLDENGTKFFG